MPSDIQVEILEDGTVSIKTSDIAETHHISADQLLDEIKSELGGKVATKPLEHPFWEKRTVKGGGKIVRTS